jgi:hypothetical protein
VKSVIDWLARALGVTNPESAFSWLRSLFLLQPPLAADKRAPVANLPVHPVIAWLASELGVTDPSSAAEWLIRLFVAPRSASVAPAVGARHLLYFRFPSLQLRRLVLPRIPTPLWLIRLQQLARHPWVLRWRTRLAPLRAEGWVGRAYSGWMGLRWLLRSLILFAAISFFLAAATTPLGLSGQAAFAALLCMVGWYASRMRGSFAAVSLGMLSVLATIRYGWWRLHATLTFGNAPEFMLGIPVVVAEGVTWVMLLWGFFRLWMSYETASLESPLPPGLLWWVLLPAPLLYLAFGVRVIDADAPLVFSFAFPHLLLAMLACSRLWGNSLIGRLPALPVWRLS